MKRIFEIEFPDECGPLWMNRDNLMTCLVKTCPNTEFTVRDITGDECDPSPASTGSSPSASSPSRVLTFKYLTLPHVVRMQIARALELVTPQDDLSSPNIDEKIFERVVAQCKLARLWDEVMLHYPDVRMGNPYQDVDAVLSLLRGTVARAYCTEKNKHKVLDPDLCEAIVGEVVREMACLYEKK